MMLDAGGLKGQVQFEGWSAGVVLETGGLERQVQVKDLPKQRLDLPVQ